MPISLRTAVLLAAAPLLALTGFGCRRHPSAAEADVEAKGTSLSPDVPPASPTPDLHLPDTVSRPPDWMLIEPEQPFDLKSFFSPVRPDANAAPLYLDALAEFDGQLSVCFPQEVAEVKRREAEDRAKNFERVYDTATRRAKPGTAAADVDRVLASYEPGFEKIARAKKRSQCVFDFSLSMNASYPHLAAARAFASVACLRVSRDLERGDFDRAIQTLEMLLRLARDLRPRGTLVAQIVAVALDGTAQRLTSDVLSSPRLSLEDADRLVRILAIREQTVGFDPLADGYRLEYVLIRSFLHDLQFKTGAFSPEGLNEWGRVLKVKIAGPGDVIAALNRSGAGKIPGPLQDMPAKEIDATLAAMKPEVWQRELKTVADYYKGLIDLSTLFYMQHADARKKLTDMVEGGLLLSLLGGPPRMVPIAIMRAAAERRGALCLAAVRRWEIKHNGPPPNLAMACREVGLFAVPIDPFADEPLRMTTIDGQPVVYSVGPDGKDDGGRVVWSYPDKPGDILFRLPPRK